MVVLNLRRCSGRNNSLAPLVEPGGSRRVGPRKALELCKRVLTTSKGHVTTAPTVPAVLEKKQKKIIIIAIYTYVCMYVRYVCLL